MQAEGIIDGSIKSVEIFSYHESYWNDDLLPSVWNFLKEDDLVDDVFHGEVLTLNEFMRLMLNAALFIAVDAVKGEFVAFAWLTRYVGKRAEISFFFRKRYWGSKLMKETVEEFFKYIFSNFEIDLLIGYTTEKVSKFALSSGFTVSGVIPKYFVNGQDAFIVYRSR
ncbi:MAG: hypothetical protein QW561_03430 [Candidatus Aenigmatarchaeota archaeon]